MSRLERMRQFLEELTSVVDALVVLVQSSTRLVTALHGLALVAIALLAAVLYAL